MMGRLIYQIRMVRYDMIPYDMKLYEKIRTDRQTDRQAGRQTES
jgi:hypothetical protein